mmetsp:Transcript_45724/g.99030  ORF Transcript_45724/g.99030 Transcript_45724/m.99030 type:complete len:203 (+) Transcript_45724:41-649(+)
MDSPKRGVLSHALNVGFKTTTAQVVLKTDETEGEWSVRVAMTGKAPTSNDRGGLFGHSEVGPDYVQVAASSSMAGYHCAIQKNYTQVILEGEKIVGLNRRSHLKVLGIATEHVGTRLHFATPFPPDPEWTAMKDADGEMVWRLDKEELYAHAGALERLTPQRHDISIPGFSGSRTVALDAELVKPPPDSTRVCLKLVVAIRK